MIDIGARMIDRAGEQWAIVPAQEVAANIYCIIDHSVEEELECELEFKPGNLVTGLWQKDGDGNEFFAARRLYGPIPI
jgi:hypothetical protein